MYTRHELRQGTFMINWGVPNMSLPSVSVIVPALNEARNIPHVFERIPKDIHEVILVDGFSVDGTVAVARELRPDVRILGRRAWVKETRLPAELQLQLETSSLWLTLTARLTQPRSPASWRHFWPAQILPKDRDSLKAAAAATSPACALSATTS